MIKNIKAGKKYPSQPKLAVGAVVFKDQGDKVEKKPSFFPFPNLIYRIFDVRPPITKIVNTRSRNAWEFINTISA